MKKEDILKIAEYWPSRILLTAAELGIFTELGESRTAEEIALGRKLDPEGTRRVLNALVGMQILDLDENSRYSIKPELQEALGDGPGSVLPGLMHRARLWELWSALPEIVRTGKHFDELGERKGRDVERLRDFITAMHVSGRRGVVPTMEALSLDGVKSVLDIGGGPGTYAASFCDALPDARVAILDMPGVPDIAREFIKETPHYDRIEFIEGDAVEIDISKVTGPDGENRFDLVFMSNLIHSMSPGEIERLFARCIRWCTPGGRIAVKDFFLDDTRTQPSWAALFAINMLVATPAGNCYTWVETEDRMRMQQTEGGDPAVANIERIELPPGIGGIIVATTVGE